MTKPPWAVTLQQWGDRVCFAAVAACGAYAWLDTLLSEKTRAALKFLVDTAATLW